MIRTGHPTSLQYMPLGWQRRVPSRLQVSLDFWSVSLGEVFEPINKGAAFALRGVPFPELAAMVCHLVDGSTKVSFFLTLRHHYLP